MITVFSFSRRKQQVRYFRSEIIILDYRVNLNENPKR